MLLTVEDIAQMIDLSCVKTNSSEEEINKLIESARKYKVGQVSVMHCFIPLVRDLLKDDEKIRIVGNVSFPSGADTTYIKVVQAKEMVKEGCDEIDVVINVAKLISGKYTEVEDDVKSVVEAADKLPVKVIIETPYLSREKIEKACEICIDAGASFVKTCTGWTPRGTTLNDIKIIKSIVGDRVKIKASGGIRDLNTLIEMYRLGARRFGVNLVSGMKILDECIQKGGSIKWG